jgi:SHAQKYF class myb-like DNA-binding protein
VAKPAFGVARKHTGRRVVTGDFLLPNGQRHHHPNCTGQKQGRWTKEEHFRFLEALKLYGKEWRSVQLHVCTRTSTQARSHAQKFFVKIDKRNLSLEAFLADLDFQNIDEQHMVFSDLEDDDEPPSGDAGEVSVGPHSHSSKASERAIADDSIPLQAIKPEAPFT